MKPVNARIFDLITTNVKQKPRPVKIGRGLVIEYFRFAHNGSSLLQADAGFTHGNHINRQSIVKHRRFAK